MLLLFFVIRRVYIFIFYETASYAGAHYNTYYTVLFLCTYVTEQPRLSLAELATPG